MTGPPGDGCENAPDSELGGRESEASEVEALPDRVARYSRARASALSMLSHLAKITNLQFCKSTPGSAFHPQRAAQKLENCGNWLVFAHYSNIDAVRLTRASFCKEHLLCPLCAIRRGAKLLGAYLARFEALVAADPSLKPYLLTVTVKNGPDLAERFEHLRRGWRLLRKRRSRARDKGVLRQVAGAVTSFEFTNRGEGWHPHLHSIVLARSEPSQAALQAEWHQTTGDSFIVDVRPFTEAEGPVGGFLEVFKYAVKFGDLTPEDRWTAFQVLRGRRLLSSFGCFRGIDPPDELTDQVLDDEPYVELFYRYSFRARGYDFVGRGPARAAASAQGSARL